MRKTILFTMLLLALTLVMPAQEKVTLRFTGQNAETDKYVRFDQVTVTNVTRNWTETLEAIAWPCAWQIQAWPSF